MTDTSEELLRNAVGWRWVYAMAIVVNVVCWVAQPSGGLLWGAIIIFFVIMLVLNEFAIKRIKRRLP